jgi:hypothetical protein
MKNALILLLFVPVVSFAMACESSPARAEEATPPVTAWHEVGAWSGDGSRQTESFDVTTGSLRMRWEVRPTGSGPARVTVWLHSAISGRPLQLLLDQSGAGSGTAFAADDPRVSYLLVDAVNAAWSIRLDEGTRAERR